MWRDNLQLDGRGSFRGVNFLVSSADSEIGRRTAVHEYPGSQNVVVEDLGPARNMFRLTCYVVGSDYDIERDKLRNEFNKPGSGKLIHPYWGEFTCTISSPVRIRETTDEGGLARFDLELTRVDDKPLTVREPDSAPVVTARADAVVAAVGEAFEAGFSLTGAIEAVRTAAVEAVQSMTDKIAAVRGTVNAALNVVDDVGASITALGDTAASLITTPLALVDAVQGVVADVLGVVSDVDAATAALLNLDDKLLGIGRLVADFRATQTYDALQGLATNGDDLGEVPDTGSTQDDIQAENQRQLVLMFRVLAITEGCRAFAELDFSTRTTAILIRDGLTAIIDEALPGITDDATWGGLIDLRDAVRDRLDEEASTLPELIDHTPATTLPAIVIAYDLYGDADRESELLALNDISNPNFVPGGLPIKVVAP